MAFCPKCAAQVPDGVGFCPACGQALGAAPPPPEQPPPQYQQPPQPYQEPPQYQQPPQQYQQPPQQYQPPPQQYQQPPQYQPPPQYRSPADDAQENKLMAVLSYLGILLLVPLATNAHKTSPFVKFHLNQGIILVLLIIGWGIVYSILTAIFTAILIASYAFGAVALINTLLALLWFIPSILAIIGIINAATGKTKQLPIIGKFTILK